MPRRKGRVWLIGAAIVLVPAGCGGGGEGKPRPRPGLSLSGGKVLGTLYLLAGESELNADVYRVRGSLGRVERLTQNARVSWISAQPGAVVTANARGAGSDHVETLNLEHTPALPGRVIDPYGQAPDLSPARQIAYSVVRYAAGGATKGTLIYVSAFDGTGKRIRFRTRDDVSANWLPGGRLAILSQPDLERPRNARVVLDAGGPRERVIDPGVPRATSLLLASDGRMLAGGGGRRAAIIGTAGERHLVDTGGWNPMCWAPDSQALLAVRGDRLGLLPASGGPVRQLGRAAGGRVNSCSWTT